MKITVYSGKAKNVAKYLEIKPAAFSNSPPSDKSLDPLLLPKLIAQRQITTVSLLCDRSAPSLPVFPTLGKVTKKCQIKTITLTSDLSKRFFSF